MLQRTILRASRQQTARQIRAFAPLRQQTPITRAVATPAIRWYSDAAPAKEGEAAEKKEDAPAQNNEATQLKEQLEKKDKEVVELKVRI
jgi:molecular chaperone GrpE